MENNQNESGNQNQTEKKPGFEDRRNRRNGDRRRGRFEEGREQNRDQNRENNRENNREQNRESNRENNRNQNRENNRENNREQNRENNRDNNRDQNRHPDRGQGRGNHPRNDQGGRRRPPRDGEQMNRPKNKNQNEEVKDTEQQSAAPETKPATTPVLVRTMYDLPEEKPVKQEPVVEETAAESAEPTAEKAENGEKIPVIGVRFRQAGKIYYFDPGKFEIESGSHVIVETARGVEYGFVILGRREVAAEKIIQPLKPVIRIATPEDEDRNQQNREKEQEALRVCKEKAIKRELDMKLIDCEYTFDNNKLLFYFTADGRIDFRELVKDLAAVFKTRIELRQIGVRDETKIRGGIGMCGRPLCCHSYLAEFAPVSIKMAKDQNLSLNPVKISGICGRLMCCLKNEQDTYEWLNSNLPNEGDYVTTNDGFKGEVQTVNVLRQLVKVIVTTDGDEKEVREYHVNDLKFKTRKRRFEDRIQDAELRELENLEKKEKGNKSKL